MSWGAFQAACYAATGQGTTNRNLFTSTISNQYHACIARHFDIISTGVVLGPQPSTIKGMLDAWTLANLNHPPQTTAATVNFIQQMALTVPLYWTGATCVGPLGLTNIIGPGTFPVVDLIQHLDYNILLMKLMYCSQIHITTMFGVFTSAQTGMMMPWSGVSLQTAG